MKLSIVVVGVVLALLQHQGEAQECECDCTCPVTASTCTDDFFTTTPTTTTTPEPTTTTTTTTTPEPTTTTTTTTTPEPTTTTTTTPKPTTTTTTTPKPTTTTTTTTSTSTTTTSTTTTSTTTSTTTTTTPKPTTTTTVITTTPYTDKEYDCGSHTINPNRKSIFTSKNYPDDYKKSTDCDWEFTCSNTNGLIYVTCEKFNTEDGSKCKKQDYVKISDGEGTLGTYCGKNNGLEHTTRDNYLKFAFATDGDKNVEKGFTCYAICTVPTTTAPTTTTTTTVAPTTTTTTTNKPSTTPAGGDYSGVCSLAVTVSDGSSDVWESPNYDGVDKNYPEGEYCCWLNVTIPSTFSMFIVTMTMGSPAKIHETSQCAGDRITYLSSSDTESTLCGDLSAQTWTEIAIFDTPKTFGFQWCSVKNDGGTDVGFQMTIAGKDSS